VVTRGLARRLTRNRSYWMSWIPGAKLLSRIGLLGQLLHEPPGSNCSRAKPSFAHARVPLKHGRHTRVASCRTAVFGCIEVPPSSSHLDTASASSPFLSACHAIITPPPSRGPWFACIRAVPSVALSLTASNVHHMQPSCTPTRSRSKLAQWEYRLALHAAALHVVALHRSSSFFRCWSRARFGLAVPWLRAALLYCRLLGERWFRSSLALRFAHRRQLRPRLTQSARCSSRVVGPF
jgi:hypothetical protein